MVAHQTSTYLADNGLQPNVLQPNVHIEISSPKESALLRVSNNILRVVDRHEDVLLVLLGLSVPLTPMLMTFCYMNSTRFGFCGSFFTG